MEDANLSQDIAYPIQPNSVPIIPFPPEISSNSKFDTVSAANDLLQNGILVETNKGLLCLSVKDALRLGIGGLNLSEEDFQNVAAQLLIQQNAEVSDTPLTLSNVTLTVLPEFQPPVSSEIIDNATPDTLDPMRFVSTEFSCPLNAANEKIETSLDSDELSAPLPMAKPGDNSGIKQNVQAAARSNTGQICKRRGGWPKGRKRKPELPEMRPPKAPATAYVLFLNERRKLYKDMPFPEVTKLLGNEWSKLETSEKLIYLKRAEEEKKRYREQLKAYWQSDIYQAYLVKKRNKNLQENITEESDMDATDEFEDEENEDLYCRICDQWFNSLHNKKEHLYGRQHFQVMSGEFTKEQLAARQNSNYLSTSTSLDESSLDGSLDVKMKSTEEPSKLEPVDMTSAITQLMGLYQARESEVKTLRSQLELSHRNNGSLKSQLSGLERKRYLLAERLELLKKQEDKLNSELCNFLILPTKILEMEQSNLILPVNISYHTTS